MHGRVSDEVARFDARKQECVELVAVQCFTCGAAATGRAAFWAQTPNLGPNGTFDVRNDAGDLALAPNLFLLTPPSLPSLLYLHMQENRSKRRLKGPGSCCIGFSYEAPFFFL